MDNERFLLGLTLPASTLLMRDVIAGKTARVTTKLRKTATIQTLMVQATPTTADTPSSDEEEPLNPESLSAASGF